MLDYSSPQTAENVSSNAMASDDCLVELKEVERRFDSVVALDRINLSIRRGEFFSLLGPSGCGKTTLLRLVAGLDTPDHGHIYIGGEIADTIPAHKRPVNTVFQSYALFPHLNVWDNIAFGLRMKKVPVADQKPRINRVMDMVEIEDLARRFPTQLSGGQRQRVALARAIVNEPKVLLLDEPLGALDLKLRKQLQVELHALQKRLGITFIYVTHDQEEAMTMSDRIAVMNGGHIEQMGEPESLYETPRTRFVAQFLGSCNLFEATVKKRSSASITVETELGMLVLRPSSLVDLMDARERLSLVVRPEKLIIAPATENRGENCVVALVEEVIYMGAETQYLLRVGKYQLRSCLLNRSLNNLTLERGKHVSVRIPAESLIVLED
jgi:spermidine/putrescine transport system ATP-binding protein